MSLQSPEFQLLLEIARASLSGPKYLFILAFYVSKQQQKMGGKKKPALIRELTPAAQVRVIERDQTTHHYGSKLDLSFHFA